MASYQFNDARVILLQSIVVSVLQGAFIIVHPFIHLMTSSLLFDEVEALRQAKRLSFVVNIQLVVNLYHSDRIIAAAASVAFGGGGGW